jgi:acyl carrier protein
MEPSELVRADARFEVLGVDSLLTLDLLNALSRFFSVNLPTTVFINYPTIELLVKYLSAEIAAPSRGDGNTPVGGLVPSEVDLLKGTLSASHLQ